MILGGLCSVTQNVCVYIWKLILFKSKILMHVCQTKTPPLNTIQRVFWNTGGAFKQPLLKI